MSFTQRTAAATALQELAESNIAAPSPGVNTEAILRSYRTALETGVELTCADAAVLLKLSETLFTCLLKSPRTLTTFRGALQRTAHELHHTALDRVRKRRRRAERAAASMTKRRRCTSPVLIDLTSDE